MNTNIRQKKRLRLAIIATGGLLLSGSVAAQAVRPDTPEAQGATNVPVTVSTSATSPSGEIIMMSPFQVDATKDQGYYADNTLAGSRMRTNIADLGASISVVTKQQMEDTASLDINDIFRYEANTEGSLTYTPVVGNQRAATGFADTISGNSPGGNGLSLTNASANRVRGLSAPSMAINFYQAIALVPFDTYNTASVEVNRGPNSMLFGMGSPAGIVNQSTAQALINKNTAQVQLRVDDRGSNRASLNFNKTLVKNKLAIYGALLYNDQQFVRKPSYDISRRQYGAITYRPFKKTTLRASIEGYSNSNRRPNFASPRDFASQWINAGKPAYDAKTGEFISGSGERVPFVSDINSPLIHDLVAFVENRVANNPDFDPERLTVNYNASGAVTAFTYTAATGNINMASPAAINNPLSPNYVKGIDMWPGRPTMFIAGGKVVGFWDQVARRTVPNWGTPANPAANPAVLPALADIWANPAWTAIYNNAQWTRSTGDMLYSDGRALGTAMTNYRFPGVTDRSIYDWKKINANQMNFGRDRNTNYNIELEQEIIPELLHFSAGWFRQDFDSTTNYTVAQLDAATLYIDTNLYLPDGTPNPYFGIPYVEDIDPDTFVRGITSDNYRAMLAFTPDFTKNKGWTKWLGRHQILGFASYMKVTDTTYRNRLMFYEPSSQEVRLRYMPNPNDDASGNPTGWAYMTSAMNSAIENGRSVLRHYYLGAPGGASGVATQASGAFANATSYSGDITYYDWDTNSWISNAATLGLVTHSAGTSRNERTLLSYSAAATSYWWEDRLITTIGVRRDINKTRLTTNAGMTNQERWIDGIYQTDAVFNRWTDWNRLAGTTSTIGGVLKPFLRQEKIQKILGGGLLGEFVENLGFSFNRSDNFDAPTGTMIDFFGTPLPRPKGTGTDYGVQFSLFKDKLFARVNWFKSTNENAAATPGQSIERLRNHVDSSSFRNWARRIVLLNLDNRDPRTNPDWGTDLTAQGITEEIIQAEVEKIWGLPYNYYAELPGTVSATQSQEARGVEATVVYNPIPNWTMRFTASRQKSVYNNVLKEVDAWFAYRNQVWSNANAVNYLNDPSLAQYTTAAGDNVDLRDFWTSYGYTSEFGPGNSNGFFVAQDYRDGVYKPEYDIPKSLEGQVTPGQRKYRASFVTNYTFIRGPLRGFAVGGGQRWESKAIIGYYGISSGAVPGRLDVVDINRPKYDGGQWYTDLWVSYVTKIFNDKVRMKLQLNVGNVFEGGSLRVTAINLDGSDASYRIIDPRQFILTATFDF